MLGESNYIVESVEDTEKRLMDICYICCNYKQRKQMFWKMFDEHFANKRHQMQEILNNNFGDCCEFFTSDGINLQSSH